MNRPEQIFTFWGTATVVLAFAHAYAFLRMARLLALSPRARTAAALVLGGLFAAGIAVMPLFRALPRDMVSPLAWFAFTWLGVLFLLILALLAGEAVLLARKCTPRTSAHDPQRRVFFQRMLGFAALGSTGLTAGGSAWNALRPVEIRSVAVPLDRLPQALNGLCIAQITDLHIGPMIDGFWLRDVVEKVNALGADIVAITGDLVDGSVAELKEHVAALRDLRARYGVYFVTGNHEYYSGVEGWVAHLGTLGIRVLDNSHVTIRAGEPLEPLVLAGVADYRSHRFPGHRADLPKALAGCDPECAVVLLAHQPVAVLEAAEYGIDLQLSGHTHGGQIWPWGYLVRLQQPYISGLHRHPGSNTQIYVSSGTGFWGPPMRLGTAAEITRLTLLAKA
ncbi:MAG TPA: metallophosphoesterase [Methylococcaceae bacterium]|nr:metallophosphoesterase [Methylococcaceae bacterium]